MKYPIEKIQGREVIDSRANPTVEATVTIEFGETGTAAVPSGASTGQFEAIELRDGDMARFDGKGVQKAVNNVNDAIFKALEGQDSSDIYNIDNIMLSLDGTKDNSNLGANAILADSLPCAHAASKANDIPLYKFLGGINATTLPVPMKNILTAGAHAATHIEYRSS